MFFPSLIGRWAQGEDEGVEVPLRMSQLDQQTNGETQRRSCLMMRLLESVFRVDGKKTTKKRQKEDVGSARIAGGVQVPR